MKRVREAPVEAPYGWQIPFQWDVSAMEMLASFDGTGLLRPFCERCEISMKGAESYDGCVLVPGYTAMNHEERTALLRAVSDAMGRAFPEIGRELGSWSFSSAVRIPPTDPTSQVLCWQAHPERAANVAFVQLVRRNFGRIHPRNGNEMALDPVIGLLAVWMAVNSYPFIPPMNIFTPGLLYAPKGDGQCTDTTRIDVQPPWSDPVSGHMRPGIVKLDWNWDNENRARPDYNVGTMLFAHT